MITAERHSDYGQCPYSWDWRSVFVFWYKTITCMALPHMHLLRITLGLLNTGDKVKYLIFLGKPVVFVRWYNKYEDMKRLNTSVDRTVCIQHFMDNQGITWHFIPLWTTPHLGRLRDSIDGMEYKRNWILYLCKSAWA